jgi:hypothetical protein
VQGLWDSFGDRTATLMAAGANYLAATWDAALAASSARLPKVETFTEKTLAAIYVDPAFVPSLTLDEIGPHLTMSAEREATTAKAKMSVRTPVRTPRRRKTGSA